MSTSRYRLFRLFVFLVFASCLHLDRSLTCNAQTPASSKTPPNVVKGTVSLKGKGVSGVVVIARPTNSDPQRRPNYRGVTDQDGHYRIPNIPSGNFQVGPAAPEYVSGQERLLILTEGETVEDIDFEVMRGGVITGKVTAGDRPLIEQQINCERIDNSGNPSGSTGRQTDDRGVYRIFGLRPGKYRVSVGQARSFMGQSTRFNQTFYPATADPAKAQAVEVTEGGEAKDIDITVEMNDESQDRYSVSGTVVNAANNEPVPGLRLRLQRADNRGVQPLNTATTSDGEGRFKFEDISPGQYSLVTAAVPDNNLRAENTRFAVADKDVTDLTVKVGRKASVSGVLVYEGAPKNAPLPALSSLFVNGYVTVEGRGGFGESARVASDGSFHMTGLNGGLATFSLGSMFGGDLRGVSISRVERDGIVQPKGLEIKGDEEITGVRLVLRYLSGVIRGSIKSGNLELPPKTQFVVWLSNRNNAESAPSQPAIVDSRGRFVIEGLADGTYEVNANATVMLPDGTTKRFQAKQQVVVQEGTVTDVTIPIDLTGNP